jgi:hypothetical protein
MEIFKSNRLLFAVLVRQEHRILILTLLLKAEAKICVTEHQSRGLFPT